MATKRAETMTYRCRLHAQELVALLCKDCYCPVCLDCLTTSHAGHTLCKISEVIEDTVNRLNDAIEGKKSSRLSLKKIEENLQNKREKLNSLVEDMIKRVTEREDEIVKEVNNVCQKTIEQIKHLATETEIPMKNDEEILKNIVACDKFQTENDDKFIKCFYFYNELKLLQDRYIASDQNDVPFSLELRNLSVEKIVELVGSVFTDEHSSSDENSENMGLLPLLHETNLNNESLPHEYKKRFNEFSFNSFVLVSTETKFLCCDDNLYHLSKSNVQELIECVNQFTYVPETDEIMYTSDTDKTLLIYRQPAFKNESRKLFFSCNNETLLCIGHDNANYLVILTETTPLRTWSMNVPEYCLRLIDDMGCPLKPIISICKINCLNTFYPRFKICQSSIVEIDHYSISVKKGFTFDSLFSYSGRKGDYSRTLSPADVCADPDGNFLVIDSKDDTVHLLNPKGKFLRLIMTDEDGLSDIECIAIDTIGWLWIGCREGWIHFANYQYFKNTTRRDRYLEKNKKCV